MAARAARAPRGLPRREAASSAGALLFVAWLVIGDGFGRKLKWRGARVDVSLLLSGFVPFTSVVKREEASKW